MADVKIIFKDGRTTYTTEAGVMNFRRLFPNEIKSIEVQGAFDDAVVVPSVEPVKAEKAPRVAKKTDDAIEIKVYTFDELDTMPAAKLKSLYIKVMKSQGVAAEKDATKLSMIQQILIANQ